MSYAEELKQKLNTNCTEQINAVIYARVSTDNEGQKESCANQVDLAKKYIATHPNINLIDIYIDDGISGKNDFTRPQYNAMIQKLSEGAFSLIITKALSRLNRDEYNSLILRNMLIENSATVLTLEDNQIHDFEDLNSGILHSLSFAMDAQYVQRQSINGKKTHELRCIRKELSAKDCSFGYTWHKDSKTITINPEQAEIVRFIFEEFVYRNGIPASIQKKLKAKDVNICSRTVINIIHDERYIGKFYINKRSSKLGTGQTKSQRFKNSKKDWILVERPDLQIIDTDLFELAQRVHQTRISVYDKPDKKTTQARFQGTHLFAGKIFCPVCGKPFHHGYADRKKKRPIYRINSHSDCTNPINRINEAEIIEITRQALKFTINQQESVCTKLEEILTECVKASQSAGTEVQKIHKQIISKEKQLDKLINTLSDDDLTESSKNRIKSKINTITAEIEVLTDTINDKEKSKLNVSYVSDKITEIKAAITELRNFTVIDRERIQNYIERIELPANGDVEILLKTGQIITVKHETRNFKDEVNVEKKRKQDVPYS